MVLLNEIKETIENEIEFIENNIMPLKEKEELSEYINFEKIKNILTQYKHLISKTFELSFESNYNDNFIRYIEEEKDSINYNSKYYKNDDFIKKLSKIKSGEINYDKIEIKNMSVGYGGGRPPMNKDEEILFSILFLENNMTHNLENFNNFINNLLILKDFSEINTNVVIIGSNGSGKSTLSRKLKIDNLNQSINIISSHHILHLTSDNFIIPRHVNEILDIDTYQQGKKLVTEDEPFDKESFLHSLHHLINYLLNLHHRQKGDTKYENVEKTILEKVLEICNKILKKEMIIIQGIIACRDNNSNIFDFNQMSDGERQVFYFVASVLVNDNDGYIIVDEPENHLNSQVCKLLWDTLEGIKKDSTFVYITHDPKFAISRKKAKIVWSKSFTYPNKWDYDVLEDKEIPEELLIEVLGSKENIIFCEGESGSLDKQIYDLLFPNEKVMAVEGHLNVINYTNAINKMHSLNVNAMGIIDSDGKTTEEIKKYTKNNIHVLPFNEVEMLLLSEEILIEINEYFRKFNEEININEWKEEIFRICNKNEEKLLMNILKSRVDKKLSMQKIQKTNQLSELKKELNNLIEAINVDEMYKYEKEKLQSILSEKNYNELLEICSLKNEVLRQVPNKFNFRNFEQRAIGVIKDNHSLKESLKEKYF